ncbi:calcium/sodium antiporter [Jhaorihella thermophila]|uniref:Cation:H+ antiporter n=1 Tax=Jhaorihella thermophila TaxID=488547 RepID=A0A1H5UZN4_9RHOB|nr:calcium/sodium antiporter [Jhaorihella thermophila]SEF80436.1 cation:H+ antiporter [Jhaorihella thermophila]
MMPWILVGLGLVILLLSGDSLVRGAVNLSLRLGVPALIVSLTVVAFGTSAPELLVSIKAVQRDAPGIALGNVVGSNIANILLVLGVPAVLSRLHTSLCDSRKTYVQMLVASVLFIALAFWGVFTPDSGLVLLAALTVVMWTMYRDASAHRKANEEALLEELEEVDPDMPYWQIGVYLLLGLIGLPLGAHLLVDNATIIARQFGVSEAVIGLTLVAVGTSLPELATTVMAALRRQTEVAMGNVIGSNMFNLLAIIGVATFFGPIPVEREFLIYDLWVMLGASLALLPFVFGCRDITRRWGVVFVGFYAVYVVAVFH